MKANYLAFIAVLIAVLPTLGQEQQGALSPELAPIITQLKYHSYLWNPAFAISRKADTYIGLYHRNSAFGFTNNPERYFLGYNGQLGPRTGIAVAVAHDREGILDLNTGVATFAYEVFLAETLRMSMGMQTTYRVSSLSRSRAIATNPDDPSLNQENTSVIAINPGISLKWDQTELSLSTVGLATFETVAGERQTYNGFGSFNAQFSQSMEIQNAVLSLEAYARQREFTESSYGVAAVYEDHRLGWIQTGYDNLFGFHAGVGVRLLEDWDLQYSYEHGSADLASVSGTHGINVTYRVESRNPRIDQRPVRVKKPKTVKARPVKMKAQPDNTQVEELLAQLNAARDSIIELRKKVKALQDLLDKSSATEVEKQGMQVIIDDLNDQIDNRTTALLADDKIPTLRISGVPEGYYLMLETHKDQSSALKAQAKFRRIGVKTNYFIDKQTTTYYLFQTRFDKIEPARERLRRITESDYRDNGWIVRVVSD